MPMTMAMPASVKPMPTAAPRNPKARWERTLTAYAPLAGEIPEAVTQVERSGGYSDDVEGHIPGVHQELLDVGVRGDAMAAEALGIKVPGDEGEGHDAGPALQGVEPVGHPGVAEHVGLPFPPDVHAVEAVEEEREPEDGRLDEDAPGDLLKLVRNVVVLSGTDQGVAVGPDVFCEESPYGYDTAK